MRFDFILKFLFTYWLTNLEVISKLPKIDRSHQNRILNFKLSRHFKAYIYHMYNYPKSSPKCYLVIRRFPRQKQPNGQVLVQTYLNIEIYRELSL